MKKLLATTLSIALLSSSAVYAGSTIDVPVPTNNVIAANSQIELNLNALTNVNVPYMVTCTLDSTSTTEPHDMDFSPKLAPKGGFGVSQINDKPTLKTVGTLKAGQNTLSFMASISTKDKPNTLTIKNLDNRYSVSIKGCSASPVSNVNSFANKKNGGGYFYITNYLPYFLDVSIGSFFPTLYCIPPNTMGYVYASTSYQDIVIEQIHN